jgi:hypothetical protein
VTKLRVAGLEDVELRWREPRNTRGFKAV